MSNRLWKSILYEDAITNKRIAINLGSFLSYRNIFNIKTFFFIIIKNILQSVYT